MTNALFYSYVVFNEYGKTVKIYYRNHQLSYY